MKPGTEPKERKSLVARVGMSPAQSLFSRKIRTDQQVALELGRRE